MTLLLRKGRKGEVSLPSVFDHFDHFFDGFLTPYAGDTTWTPRADIVEKAKDVRVKADLPGLTENDIKVELNDGYLTITGERKEEKEEKDGHRYTQERHYGTFTRSFAIDADINEEAVEAKFSNGTLEVIMPKLKEEKPQARVIPIKK